MASHGQQIPVPLTDSDAPAPAAAEAARWTCPICNDDGLLSNRYRHLSKHTTQCWWHPCPDGCPKFDAPRGLTDHLLHAHNGRNALCPWPKCEHRLSTRSDVRVLHLRQHIFAEEEYCLARGFTPGGQRIQTIHRRRRQPRTPPPLLTQPPMLPPQPPVPPHQAYMPALSQPFPTPHYLVPAPHQQAVMSPQPLPIPIDPQILAEESRLALMPPHPVHMQSRPVNTHPQASLSSQNPRGPSGEDLDEADDSQDGAGLVDKQPKNAEDWEKA
ncbi:uncharacterized protein BCR38DRAFT_409284 [Pseudomassariella vexata]|uniref:Uncharacterized protein n=1 Tax=Pseudomassariella vexata TaxID=1141098 RepID=A0A1Y2DXL6_9PEZI|nr:uncharacterized protein BCR38DRAFT_409284 [Pseudomassariella vexata]ORY63866.1 hypothetical protein BCR38DRAFT_409284 [Pseudomassariella vexata]